MTVTVIPTSKNTSTGLAPQLPKTDLDDDFDVDLKEKCTKYWGRVTIRYYLIQTGTISRSRPPIIRTRDVASDFCILHFPVIFERASVKCACFFYALYLLNKSELLRNPHGYFRYEGTDHKRNYHGDKKRQNVAHYFGHRGFGYAATEEKSCPDRRSAQAYA